MTRNDDRQFTRLAAAALLAASLSACAGNLPKIGEGGTTTGDVAAGSGATKIAPAVPVAPKTSPAEGEQPAAPKLGPTRTAANEEANIVGFRGTTVVLYSSESGNEGERVPAASLPIPLRARGSLSNSSRLTFQTASGPRWISNADVVIGPAH